MRLQAWTSSSAANVGLFLCSSANERSLRLRCGRYGCTPQLSTTEAVKQVEAASIVLIGPRTDIVYGILKVLRFGSKAAHRSYLDLRTWNWF